MTNKDYKPLTTGGYANPKMLQEYRDRLCYLEDCIKKSTLVFLPCKVGDNVYFVNRWTSTPRIEVWHILAIEITSDGIEIGAYRISNQNQKGFFYPRSFGDEVFTTKEAAEKALEELEK